MILSPIDWAKFYDAVMETAIGRWLKWQGYNGEIILHFRNGELMKNQTDMKHKAV